VVESKASIAMFLLRRFNDGEGSLDGQVQLQAETKDLLI